MKLLGHMEELAIEKRRELLRVRVEEEELDDGVGDECIMVWEEREERDSKVRGERENEVFDEVLGEEWIVMLAGNEELSEDLRDMGREVEEG